MKIAFLSTIEESTNANLRLQELSGIVVRQMWIGAAGIAVAVCGIAILIPGAPSEKAAFGIAAGVIGEIFWLTTYRSQHRARIRRSLVRMLGTDQPVPAEYELTPEAIVFRKSGIEIRFGWENVAGFRETKDTLEIIMNPLGLAVLPKRIFPGPEDLVRWLEYIEERISR